MTNSALAPTSRSSESPAPSSARVDSSRTSNTSSYPTPTSHFPSSTLPSRPSSSSSRPSSSHPPSTSPPPIDVRDSPSPLLLPFSHPSSPPSLPLHSTTSLDVRRRRKAEHDKHRRMLDRRTVIDVKKIRERRERGEGGGVGVQAKAGGEGDAKLREERAEELLREAKEKEEDRRKKREKGRGRLVDDDEDGRSTLTTPAQPLYRRVEVVEEAKEQQLTIAPPSTPPETFLTSTHDVQSTPSPIPHLSRLPSSSTSTSLPPPSPSSSPPPHPAPPIPSDPSDEGISAYHTFINQRVQHMLVSNSVFIPHLHDHLVATPHNLTLASTHPSASLNPPHTPSPHFHLPSLQPPQPPNPHPLPHHPHHPYPTHPTLLPSSASIALASADERSLYHLLLFLSRVPLFASLPLSHFFRLGRQVKEVRFDEFEVVANEGEVGEVLYIVREGRIDTKLNLERHGGVGGGAGSPPTSPRAGGEGEGAGAGGGGGGLRRRFHSINLASLDVACLTAHDVCGESVLAPPHLHLTSLISMTPSVCYALPLSTLPLTLTPSTLISLRLYTRHSLALTRTYLAVRERYRSSYHTSVVDFRLFVEGSLRRNLRHKNERGRMRAEIEEGGGKEAGGWGRDRDAAKQIAHAQRMEKQGAGKSGRGKKWGEEEKEGAGEALTGGGQTVERKVGRSTSLPPVFLSFTTVNLGESVSSSASSSPLSSTHSRGLPLLSPSVVGERAHPALR